LARKLKKWETEYNEDRRELVQPFKSVSDLS
jgi:hypothetical protein